ncbi:S8 family serine peptidase [Lutimaribacter marinistellae]|uniref:S8 family serine peptidase n=1 Tax=Lutimaribacter marinistellae TaxID=1820329 RepID=A0ABV7TND8_9RHOB
MLRAFFTLIAAVSAGAVQAQMAVPEITLDWRSRAETPAELSIEIERLYLSLYNSANLNLREVEIGSPPYVETLLRVEGAMHGAHFPLTLDAMMCDLNPSHCRRERSAASWKILGDLTAHVGGYRPTRGNWRLQGGETLKIPAYAFESVTTLQRRTAPKGWTTQSFEPVASMDCSAWNKSCQEVVEQYNPRLLNAPKVQTRVTVPVLHLETTLFFRPDFTSKRLSELAEIGVGTKGAEPITFNGPENFEPGWLKRSDEASLTDIAIETIQGNLAPVGRVDLQWLEDEPFVQHQMDLFKIIKHPYGNHKELGEPYKQPVSVLVIDAPLTSGHCDLPIMRAHDGTEIPLLDEDGCDSIDQTAISNADHAAAVAGVIGSQRNGKGTVGLNPYAQLWLLAFDKDLVADQQIAALIDQIQRDIPRDVRVANLSFGIRPQLANPQDIANAMDIHEDRLLIVAAAGNDGLELSRENCRIYPACLNDLGNVLTVVGLDTNMDSPGLWRSQTAGSNSSPDFDLGAPAEGVLTTVTRNRFARQKGTSFAAPQVTAAASLIFAAGEFIYGDDLGGGQLSPRVVKDRLLYSADFFPGLSKSVKYGRLNVDRAIRIRDAQFVLFDGREITGQVVEAPRDFVCVSPSDQDKFHKWYDLRRLSFNDAKGRHFMFQHEGGDLGSRYGTLVRDPSCLIDTLSAKVRVQTRDETGRPTDVEFEFRDIRDYTSPLFDR